VDQDLTAGRPEDEQNGSVSAAGAQEDRPPMDMSEARQSEAVLLGTVLAYPASAPEVIADLAESDFTEPAHRAVLAAMRQLIEAGVRCEPLLVVEQLVNRPSDHASRGTHWPAVCAQLLGQASIPSSAAAYRRLVLTALWRREAIAFADRLEDCARAGTIADLDDVLTQSNRQLSAAVGRVQRLAPPWRVLVTGPRVRWDREREGVVTGVLDELRAAHVHLVIVHGADPKGVDPIAVAWATRHQVELEAHAPDWDAYEKAAGPRRIKQMVNSRPDECHAFTHRGAPSDSGCADLARRAGIATTVHT